jgi:TetR/AcrR family transcriptional repressor of nem operon
VIAAFPASGRQGAGTMSKEATKSVLLEAGKSVFLAKGYNNSGIETILQAARVPKGSFYYYFDSKEDFGLQVLNKFADEIRANFERALSDPELSPLERLRKYFEDVCVRLESQQCRNGCLIGNLSQEMADQSEAFRARLQEIFDGMRDRYADCLRVAQEAGQIEPGLDATELAEFCLGSWQGAILRAKTARNVEPIRVFIKILFGTVLRTPEGDPSRVEHRK